MKLRITEQQAHALRLHRDAGNKHGKKAVWADIRATFSSRIPFGAKLGVDLDPASGDNYRALYVKDTEPRRYLTALETASTPASTPAPAPAATNGQFVTVTPAPTGREWACIKRDDLLLLLRGDDAGDIDDYVEYRPTLPVGFPTTSSEDALVLDSTTGTLYFRS